MRIPNDGIANAEMGILTRRRDKCQAKTELSGGQTWLCEARVGRGGGFMPVMCRTQGLAETLSQLGYTDVLMVPCSILRERFDPAHFERTWFLSREEEGVGIGVGLLATGSRPILLIQNSGLGNSINALSSLATAYEIPLVVGLTMRGDDVEENPAQIPIGLSTVGIIEAMGCYSELLTSLDQLTDAFMKAEDEAKRRKRPAFVLIPRESQLAH
ncbi:thiamine pyrophosphate-binding protein [Rathayibacter toxicus]|uniref:thiamine pyrophosphate-binding protein n=1 Tax=Rathayibacter toxicus TaxID=145458 RepID=UPI0015E20A05|nr:thiamine pyrophosphate-binding protein [Rathayibacter toxicus]